MCPRITSGIHRPHAITILVNGATVTAYEGESIATALMASDTLIMSRDSSGRARSAYCNMGVCFDCLVAVEESMPDGRPTVRRVRACLAVVRPGLVVTVAP